MRADISFLDKGAFIEYRDDEEGRITLEHSQYSITIRTSETDSIHIGGLENRSRFIAALKLFLASIDK